MTARPTTLPVDADRVGGRPEPKEEAAGEGRDVEELEDRELIAAFLAGEEAAVDRIRGWLERAAGRYRRRIALPWEDVLQELLAEATSRLRQGSFRGDARLETYVSRIAHYRCLNLLRGQARSKETGMDEDDAPERLRAPGSSPLEQFLERESRDLLTRFVAELPAGCRRLWAQILAGKSYREMSEELGVSEGALRVRVLRCRRKATALWERWPGGGR